MTITEFLLARIADDEAVALEAMTDWAAGHWAPEVYDDGVRNRAVAFAPARVLAECEAKRRIVEHTEPDQYVLRHLAAVYADHPDYRDEWRP